MNKMAKGALAIGIGSALLLGGGGTLAVWNQTEAANAGQIAAGDLSLKAETGTWYNGVTKIDDISKYTVVPGETLTFTQPLTVKLEGTNMKAKLAVDHSGLVNNFNTDDLTVSGPTVKNKTGDVLGTELTPASNKEIVASVSVTFNNTTALSSVKATANLNEVKYKLEQIAPGTK